MQHLYVAAALRHAEWALECLMLPPLAAVLCLAAISFVWSGLTQRPFRKGLWRPHHWFVLSHLLFFVAAIFVGLFWAQDPASSTRAGRAATVCLGAVFYGSLASCLFWIWQMKGFRWFAASLMILAEVTTMGAIFVAGMSISGDWL